MNYSENPNGNQGARVRDIARPQPTPHDFKEDENISEQASATVSRYMHPVEAHFAPTTGRGPLGRGISKHLAEQLGVKQSSQE